MNKEAIYAGLCAIFGADRVLTDTPMKDHTTFRVGGPADFMVLPESTDELVQVLDFCQTQAAPFYLMGNGSNLIVRDGGFRGIIVNTREFDDVSVRGENEIAAQGGALLRKVAAKALDNSLAGLAFASGIPGSVGGAVAMNAGAYGGEMKDVIREVRVLTPTGETLTLAGEDCHFGYRKSVIRDNHYIVLSAVFALTPGEHDAIAEEMAALSARRRDKQPLNYPSAGSTFKRPEGYFAGKLIQDAGLKGYTVGGAQVSEKHSGFVINTGGATAADILTLIADVQAQVKAQFGVELTPEVIAIGEDAEDA